MVMSGIHVHKTGLGLKNVGDCQHVAVCYCTGLMLVRNLVVKVVLVKTVFIV